MNKNALHPDEVKVIRGEAKILEMLVDEPNVVQIRNVSLKLDNLGNLVLRNSAAYIHRDGIP